MHTGKELQEKWQDAEDAAAGRSRTKQQQDAA
jgi:hypothetical protein